MGGFRQALWIVNGEAFVAARVAFNQFHLVFGHAKGLGQELDKVGIGLAINRWGCDPHLQAIGPMGPNDFVLAGSRLNADV